MKYIPELTDKEIEDNRRRFEGRASVYRGKGLDFMKSRMFIIEKAAPLEGRILEIGTGNGHMTLTLAKAGHKFTAIDKDAEALKTTALNLAHEDALSGVELHVMDGESLTFADGSFDNVVIVDLFHHITDIGVFLSEADRVLRERGKLVLADFNKRGMEIVNSVHRSEGRTHEDSGVGQEHVNSYLCRSGYEVKSHKDEFHWILIAKKQGRRKRG